MASPSNTLAGFSKMYLSGCCAEEKIIVKSEMTNKKSFFIIAEYGYKVQGCDRACQSLGGRLRLSFSVGARARHNRSIIVVMQFA